MKFSHTSKQSKTKFEMMPFAQYDLRDYLEHFKANKPGCLVLLEYGEGERRLVLMKEPLEDPGTITFCIQKKVDKDLWDNEAIFYGAQIAEDNNHGSRQG